MAKSTMIKIKLLSSADTGYFYVTKKNSRTQTEKMVKKKYDPVGQRQPDFTKQSQASRGRLTWCSPQYEILTIGA